MILHQKVNRGFDIGGGKNLVKLWSTGRQREIRAADTEGIEIFSPVRSMPIFARLSKQFRFRQAIYSSNHPVSAKKTTSFPGTLSSCPSSLGPAHLLTSVLTDLLVTRTNSLAVEVLKGHKAEHLMNPRPSVESHNRQERICEFPSRRNVTFYGLLPFISSLPSRTLDGCTSESHGRDSVDINLGLGELVRLGRPVFTSPLLGPVLGSSPVRLGKDERGEFWRPLDMSHSENRKWSGWPIPRA